MLPLILICVIVGFVVGAITVVFSSVGFGLAAGCVAMLVTFLGFLFAGIVLNFLESPEQKAISELERWLEIELGSKPRGCEVEYHVDAPWPLSGKVESVYLCRYSYGEADKSENGIALAWPQCFAFHDLDFDIFTPEELFACYRGVYVVLMGRRAGMNADRISKSEWSELSSLLNSTGFDANVTFGNLRAQAIRTESGSLLFAVEVKRDGKPTIAVGDLSDPASIETRDHQKYGIPVAHYSWVDKWWSTSLAAEDKQPTDQSKA